MSKKATTVSNFHILDDGETFTWELRTRNGTVLARSGNPDGFTKYQKAEESVHSLIKSCKGRIKIVPRKKDGRVDKSKVKLIEAE